MEADRLTLMRRDYGAAPKGLPMSKIQERRMREQNIPAHQNSLPSEGLAGFESRSSEEWDQAEERQVFVPAHENLLESK